MSKYDSLWAHTWAHWLMMSTFDEIAQIAGLPLDHSFLTYRKELLAYGCRVGKISMKEQTVAFERIEDA